MTANTYYKTVSVFSLTSSKNREKKKVGTSILETESKPQAKVASPSTTWFSHRATLTRRPRATTFKHRSADMLSVEKWIGTFSLDVNQDNSSPKNFTDLHQ